MNENFKKTTLKLINGEDAIIIDSDKLKVLKSENYNFLFKKDDGFFARWGKTKEDDGDPRIMIPSIADIEIDTQCSENCSYCYKSNIPNMGKQMSLDTYKKVLSKITEIPSITQIALGITDIDSNKYFFDIVDYTRSCDIVPNVTINGSRMTSELYDKLAQKMGAIAVSVHRDKNKSYNTVKELTDRGMTQVNLHIVVHSGNFDFIMEVFNDILYDSRLKSLNACVLLSLKPKGRADKNFKPINQSKYKELVLFALDNNIGIGADSCGCFRFYDAIKDTKYKQYENYLESCESTTGSLYISCEGDFYPCSFAEDIIEPISVLHCDNFMSDVWYAESTNKFREKNIKCKECSQNCQIYDI